MEQLMGHLPSTDIDLPSAGTDQASVDTDPKLGIDQGFPRTEGHTQLE